ncbi:MAG: DUF4295 family protein [Fidelibacterota bacterium]
MAKGTSFAAKSKGKSKKTQSFVKYVKSIKSEKTGHWRFNEQMVALNEGENIDSALKRLKKNAMALDMEMPVFDEPKTEEAPKEVEKKNESKTESNKPMEESVDALPVDESKEAVDVEEDSKSEPKEEAKEDSADKKDE